MRYSYLACPYAHRDPAIRQERFEAVTQVLAQRYREGLPTYSPITHNHPLATAHDLPGGWAFWSKFDLPILLLANELVVLMLPGWIQSVGVTAEIEFASKHKILTSYIEYIKP